MAKQTFTLGQVLTAAQVTALQTNDYNQTVSVKTASYTLVAADVGTRIEMNSGSATTVTVNTALFAAGDTLVISNKAAGVSTVTAGTATVSTSGSLALAQYDQGTLYFVSTGVAIFFNATAGAADIPKSILTTNGDMIYATGASTPVRLGIGSSAQVLTVAGGIPSWATPAASASGLTFLSATTFSNVATTSTSAVFTSTYSNYRIMVKVKGHSSGTDVSLRFRVSGTDNSTSNYAYVFPYYQMDGVGAGTTKNSAQSSMLLASISSSDYSWAAYDIYSPQLSESTAVTGNMTLKNGASSSYYMYLFGGLFATTTAFDAFTLLGVTANITGEVRVYGYQNS